MKTEYIDLVTLLSGIKEGVKNVFPHPLWVRAEIASINRKSMGHCYMELVQYEGEGMIAKATGIIWASKYVILSDFFKSEAGTSLEPGMKILAEVVVNYSEMYGLSLIINNIDPSYTVGEKELARQKTIDRLHAEGLLERQSRLELTTVPRNLAVISAENAAGYEDFCRHLHDNEYGYKFSADLFPAIMQGYECSPSVVGALSEILEDGKEYDAILILRGGGAKLDLVCFDEYEMARAIALSPVPVFTAVGHEKDFHVCDMVSFLNLKTPTALADFFISGHKSQDDRISSYSRRLRLAFSSKIERMLKNIDISGMKLKNALIMSLNKKSNRLSEMEQILSSHNPKNIIRKGYALVVGKGGVVIKGISGAGTYNVKVGDDIKILFGDGEMECEIKNISDYHEN